VHGPRDYKVEPTLGREQREYARVEPAIIIAAGAAGFILAFWRNEFDFLE
jgi:hypothetical protein